MINLAQTAITTAFNSSQLPVPHPITGFKDDSAFVTTKTAVRITVVLNIIYMVYNIFHALTL